MIYGIYSLIKGSWESWVLWVEGSPAVRGTLRAGRHGLAHESLVEAEDGRRPVGSQGLRVLGFQGLGV